MSVEARIRAYYDALRNGVPLDPYFAADEGVVKFGLSEHLDGGDAVADALQRQTRRTANWTVDSRHLRVTERDCHAWFADRVALGWTDVERGRRFAFDTRWSGTLERPADPPTTSENPAAWQFVLMHVSTAEEV